MTSRDRQPAGARVLARAIREHASSREGRMLLPEVGEVVRASPLAVRVGAFTLDAESLWVSAEVAAATLAKGDTVAVIPLRAGADVEWAVMSVLERP